MNREVKPTTKFVRGDVAVMFGCAEALLPKYNWKKWICRTDSFFTDSGVEVVFLEGFIGYFIADNLTKVSENEIRTKYVSMGMEYKKEGEMMEDGFPVVEQKEFNF